MLAQRAAAHVDVERPCDLVATLHGWAT
jgi:hypothetical protein